MSLSTKPFQVETLRVELPLPDPTNRVIPSGQLAPRASDEDAHNAVAGATTLYRIPIYEDTHRMILMKEYPVVHLQAGFCLEHPVIHCEDQLNLWIRPINTIVCDALHQKTDHCNMIREPSDVWWRRVEEANKHRVWPGDTFLVRQDEHEYEYFTPPAISLPRDWTPCAGTTSQQWDERIRAIQTLNKDRTRNTCVVCYDYLTVYTTTGRWRRKMVAYEKGTPSPFHFEYYDARNHHPTFTMF